MVGIGISLVLGALATINLSALASFWIKRRQREPGIRVGIGASMNDISKMLFIEQAFMITIAFGFAVALFQMTQTLIQGTGLIVALGGWQIIVSAGIGMVTLTAVHVATMRRFRKGDIVQTIRRG